jgi:hypothetical protein
MEEEVPEPEILYENEQMDTGKDPDPPEPPQLIAAPTPPAQKNVQTKTTKHTPSGGGYFPPTTTQKTRQRKKIPPPVQPKMKAGGLKDLQQYNQDFKRWQMRLVGQLNDKKETIKAYVSGLANKIILMLLKDGHEFKKTKTLAKWQQAAETAVAKREGTLALGSFLLSYHHVLSDSVLSDSFQASSPCEVDAPFPPCCSPAQAGEAWYPFPSCHW